MISRVALVALVLAVLVGSPTWANHVMNGDPATDPASATVTAAGHPVVGPPGRDVVPPEGRRSSRQPAPIVVAAIGLLLAGCGMLRWIGSMGNRYLENYIRVDVKIGPTFPSVPITARIVSAGGAVDLIDPTPVTPPIRVQFASRLVSNITYVNDPSAYYEVPTAEGVYTYTYEPKTTDQGISVTVTDGAGLTLACYQEGVESIQGAMIDIIGINMQVGAGP